jgi:cobalt-zinc-cadmium efflux system membrane fusion protein
MNVRESFQFASEIRLHPAKRLLPRRACQVALPLMLAGVVGFASGCGSQQLPVSASSSTGQNSASQSDLFTVPPEQMSHIHVIDVTPSRLDRVLRLTGAVAYNAFQTTPIISQAGGPVSRIVVSPGDHVSAGQPMLYVTSPDYSAQSASFMKARTAFDLADKNYKRADDLYAHHAIAEKDLQQAESDRNQAQADLEASAAALRILGIRDPDSLAGHALSSEIPLLAPIGGEVVERLVSPGQLLQPGATQCFTISDMSSVWILVNVYQKDLADVHVGDSVAVQSDAYPEVFHGTISYVAPALDPNTRTVQARIVTPNPSQKLKKDMYVTAIVNAGSIPNALAVPDAAVLRDTENLPFVYVQTGANQFARHQVNLGFSQGGRTQITDGLKPGEHIVDDGGIFLQFQNSLQH